MTLPNIRLQIYRLSATRNESRARLTEVRNDLARFAAEKRPYPKPLVEQRDNLFADVKKTSESLALLNQQKIDLEQNQILDFQHQKGVREILCAGKFNAQSQDAQIRQADQLQRQIAKLKA